jgi:hypothetical protein
MTDTTGWPQEKIDGYNKGMWYGAVTGKQWGITQKTGTPPSNPEAYNAAPGFPNQNWSDGWNIGFWEGFNGAKANYTLPGLPPNSTPGFIEGYRDGYNAGYKHCAKFPKGSPTTTPLSPQSYGVTPGTSNDWKLGWEAGLSKGCADGNANAKPAQLPSMPPAATIPIPKSSGSGSGGIQPEGRREPEGDLPILPKGSEPIPPVPPGGQEESSNTMWWILGGVGLAVGTWILLGRK